MSGIPQWADVTTVVALFRLGPPLAEVRAGPATSDLRAEADVSNGHMLWKVTAVRERRAPPGRPRGGPRR